MLSMMNMIINKQNYTNNMCPHIHILVLKPSRSRKNMDKKVSYPKIRHSRVVQRHKNQVNVKKNLVLSIQHQPMQLVWPIKAINFTIKVSLSLFQQLTSPLRYVSNFFPTYLPLLSHTFGTQLTFFFLLHLLVNMSTIKF